MPMLACKTPHRAYERAVSNHLNGGAVAHNRSFLLRWANVMFDQDTFAASSWSGHCNVSNANITKNQGNRLTAQLLDG
eukprot:356617-Chlamydomonas_euryale.AAC.7